MRITIFGIWSIGLVATIVVAFAIWGLGVRPTGTLVAFHDEYIQKAQLEIDKEPIAHQRVAKAKAIVQQARLDWADDAAMYGLPPSIIDFSQDRLHMALQAWTFPSKLGHTFYGYANKTGVDLMSIPTVGPLPSNPNEIISRYFNGDGYPILIAQYNFGDQSVRGSFPHILQHYRNWSNLRHYLVLVDNLRFQGTTPNLIGQYNATVYVLPQSPVNPANTKAIPNLGATASSSSGPGYGGTATSKYQGSSNESPVGPSGDTGGGGRGNSNVGGE
jgi:hypothetical protein